MAHLVPIVDLDDPRLGDYAHQTDVALKKSGGEHGLYLAESLLVHPALAEALMEAAE